MLAKEEKRSVIGEYRLHDNDTGSPEVQVAVLTTRIQGLTEHLKENKKDYSSRRGLLKMIGQRRNHLNYLKRKAPQRYQQLIKRLGLKR